MAMVHEHSVFNLGYVDEVDFREALDQDWYGLYRRKGYKIPAKYRKQYRMFKKERNKALILEFRKQSCKATLIRDILTLIKLLRLG